MTSKSEPKQTAEEFVSRWSRRKQQAREQVPAPVAPKSDADEAAPVLPPVEELGMDSDYKGFFHPKVDEVVRRAALKKLFSDPHFSLIDGLDIYLDDYSISDPLPAEALAGLKQAQKILGWAKEDREAEAARERVADAETTAQPAIADSATDAPELEVDQPEAVAAKQESPDDGTQTT